jgi:hypothetical protein
MAADFGIRGQRTTTAAEAEAPWAAVDRAVVEAA